MQYLYSAECQINVLVRLCALHPPPPIPNRYEKLYNLDFSTFSKL